MFHQSCRKISGFEQCSTAIALIFENWLRRTMTTTTKKIILVSWIKLNWQIPDTQKKQCPAYKERVWLLWSDSWATGQAMPPKHILSNLMSQAGCGKCKIFSSERWGPFTESIHRHCSLDSCFALHPLNLYFFIRVSEEISRPDGIRTGTDPSWWLSPGSQKGKDRLQPGLNGPILLSQLWTLEVCLT